jgi:hypothetical protein
MTTIVADQNDAKTTARIAAQNDRFRTTFGADHSISGKILFTQGVAALSVAVQTKATQQVQTFCVFNDDNDPYRDHSFGAFDLMVDGTNTKFFWKIDLYDAAYKYGSPDPARTHVTRRVLTVMLASEY